MCRRRSWLPILLLSLQLIGAGAAMAEPWATEGTGSVMSGLELGRAMMSGGMLGFAPRWVGLALFCPVIACAVAMLGLVGRRVLCALLAVVVAAVGPVGIVLLSMTSRLGLGGVGALAAFGCAAVLLVIAIEPARRRRAVSGRVARA